MSKLLLCFVAVALFTITSLVIAVYPLSINADVNPNGILIKNDRLNACPKDKSQYGVAKKVTMIITAYSSSPDETDDTPNITASGKHVEDGIIATNGIPFGTEIRIPELYGDKVFVVEDRMHPRKKGILDVWMPSKTEAKNFGVKVTDIEILES